MFKHTVTQARAQRGLQKICPQPPANPVPHSSLLDMEILGPSRTWHSASMSSPSSRSSVAPHGDGDGDGPAPMSYPESRATLSPQAMVTHTHTPSSPDLRHGSPLAVPELLGRASSYTPAKTFAKCLHSAPDGLFPASSPDTHHPPHSSASTSLDHHLGGNVFLPREEEAVPGTILSPYGGHCGQYVHGAQPG